MASAVKEVVTVKPMMMLPPRPGLCQICAIDHPVTDPHDATTLFYRMKFKMDFGRDPTWEDAMAHCSEDLKGHWRKHLKSMFQVDTQSANVRGNA